MGASQLFLALSGWIALSTAVAVPATAIAQDLPLPSLSTAACALKLEPVTVAEFTRSQYVMVLDMISKQGSPAEELKGIARLNPAHLKRIRNWGITLQQVYAREHTDEAVEKNAGHIRDLAQTLEEAQNSAYLSIHAGSPTLEPKEVLSNLEFLRTLVFVHDVGKVIKNPLEARLIEKLVAEGVDPGTAKNLYVRIGLHGLTTLLALGELAREHPELEPEVRALMAASIGHNEGSGLVDVFWRMLGHPAAILGEYPLPEQMSLMGLYMAALDRSGQASLGVGRGVDKVIGEQVRNGGTFGRKLLDQVLSKNAVNTVRQLDGIEAAIFARTGLGPRNSFVLRMKRTARLAGSFADSIRWDADGVCGSVEGLSTGGTFCDVVSFQRVMMDWLALHGID